MVPLSVTPKLSQKKGESGNYIEKPGPTTQPSTAVTFGPQAAREDQDMTETLAEKKCTPCRGGIAPLTHEEAERFRSQTPNWELRDDGRRIERTLRFSNFR